MESVVVTRSGQVRGATRDGVRSFLGIPYAAPPVGALRMMPPVPAASWHGVRDATQMGVEPPQPRRDPKLLSLIPDPGQQGDDCLNLNVWTPEAAPAAAMPVMVWIPIGAFEACPCTVYDGSRFARDGVVFVTVNSRVGADGFLYLGGADPVANAGLLDQAAALEWVRDNIAAFGGDPSNVTLLGESAGAMSVGTLLGMPAAAGLFRRAIMQSGASKQVAPAATAAHIGRELAAKLGVPPERQAIAATGPDRVLEAQAALKADIIADRNPARWGAEVCASLLPWQPAVDGHVLPEPPLDRIRAGAAAGIDVLVGSNTDDWRLFSVADGSIASVTEEMITGPVAKHGYRCIAAYGLDPGAAIAAYREARPGCSAGDLLAMVQTDWWCRIPALRLADAHAGQRAATWMYEFTWPSPAFGGLLGACHALEIPFVFDTLDRGPNQMVGPLLGPSPPQPLADAMHGAWVAFARTGDPGWPQYDVVRRQVRRFGAEPPVVDDPYAATRRLWEGIR